MNLLFIHGNFPGQFINLAPFLARNISGRTVFLTESDNPQKIHLDGIDLMHFELHREPSESIHTYLKSCELCVLRGQAVVRALDQLRSNGFIPDIVVVHGGRGYGMYVKDILSQVRLISYVEWFARPDTTQTLFSDFSFNDQLAVGTGMWPLLQEMLVADDLICPTYWQRNQFPSPWREQIRIIFDGVDNQLFQPGTYCGNLVLNSGSSNIPVHLSHKDHVLTFATRGMEPLRGFPEFMRAAAVAMHADPRLSVVIAGMDRVVYSYKSPHPSGSWKEYMLEELADSLDLTRLHFTGLLSYGELVSLLQRSDLHCYFTRPYVISWSVFNAAACGARLMVNNFPGLDEVLDPDDLLLPPINLESQAELTSSLLKGLALPRSLEMPKSYLRAGLLLDECLLSWLKLIREG